MSVPLKMYQLNLQNFGIHRDLSVSLPKTGVVLIKGANGAGKSTILDAIYHTLNEISTATKTSLARKYSRSPATCTMKTSLVCAETSKVSAECTLKITVAKTTGKLSVGRGKWNIQTDLGSPELIPVMYLRQFCLAETSGLEAYFKARIVDHDSYENIKKKLDERISLLSKELSVARSTLTKMQSSAEMASDEAIELSEKYTQKKLDEFIQLRNRKENVVKEMAQYENFMRDEKIRADIAALPKVPAQSVMREMMSAYMTSQKEAPPKPKDDVPANFTDIMANYRRYRHLPNPVHPLYADKNKILAAIEHEKRCRSVQNMSTCPCCGKPCIIQHQNVKHFEDADMSVLKQIRPLKGVDLDGILAVKDQLSAINIKSNNDIERITNLVSAHERYNQHIQEIAALKMAPSGYEKWPELNKSASLAASLSAQIRYPNIRKMEKPAQIEAYMPELNDILMAKSLIDMRKQQMENDTLSAKISSITSIRQLADSAAVKCMQIILEVYNERLSAIIGSFNVPLSVEIVNDQDGYDIVDTNTRSSWRTLSGGQQMMVSIALTIALGADTKFPFILIDESFSCITESVKENIIETLRVYCPQKCVLVVDHEGIDGLYDECINL